MKYRPVVLCIFEKNSRYLMQKFKHRSEDYYFYRPIGGGIEPDEPPHAAMQRELREELQIDVDNAKLLGVFENRFTYGHEERIELVHLFKADYDRFPGAEGEPFSFVDNEIEYEAVWLPAAEIKSGQVLVYPDRLKEFI
jgi:8-oxo-dGTP pyrophosphatase MutT (NUDIX family)